MSAVPLDTLFGENQAEKENSKPRTVKKSPVTLPEVQTEHAVTRDAVREIVREAIKELKAELLPSIGDIAKSVVSIADALEEMEARGVFENLSLKDGPEKNEMEEEKGGPQPPEEVNRGEPNVENESDQPQGAQNPHNNPAAHCRGSHARGRFNRGGHRGNHRMPHWNQNYDGHRHGGYGYANAETKAQARRFFNMRRRGSCSGGPSNSSGSCRCADCSGHHSRFRPYGR
ncbi:hypothetical protein niasHT_008834 [Heterodera trifolii]|uniref:Uncharacterized protein n=1 Tax=Heterodera trifolii TaxID=157864 RepID=A0ABD2L420_9BILA